MTIPGVGPVVALGFVSTIDIPGRFKNSKVELPPKDRTCSGLRLRSDELARGLIS
ncbi:hypothetical protein CN934_28715 [Ensifer sp. MMN_5]|nr:hypothetical protein CN934_28715 [Ensifer sp. MMN_5]